MASAIKAKIQKATGGDGGDTVDEEEVEKYKLLVTAGPSYDQSQHETIKVNSNECVYVENEFLRAKVNVRCKGFKGRGLPSSSPASTPYFDDPVHEKDQYSIGISFVPKVDIPSLDTVWGNDFDHPVRNKLPPGFNTAFKIVKEFIDPGDKVEQGADFPGPDDHNAMKEGGDGSGQAIRSRLSIPENGDKRRKYFLDSKHRENFTFEKGRLYESDFYNPYIDFPNFSLKLPGFSLKIIKYIDQQSHCLRYVFKNRSTGDMYLNVNFRLLWGEQLQKALKKDGEQKQISSQPSAVAQQATAGAVQPDEHPRPAMRPSHSSLSGQPLVGPETAGEQDARIRTSNGVPLTMQLHPGDQGAAGEYNSGPEVIARMLKETSTNDISGTNVRVLGSNVD
ncbi:hypothetical protein LTR97_008489 [Elasticomyces elasticus]|uniref:Domain of unknown function at the cortex 1 domain-containing protein n=1 Tax=Elasticomyces elasticus TaxID=574655 RepID=A0AAN7W7W1_9PEZI|nr:hypothetical protein LTR97_008489 [Elasticomyces elasticus]